MGSASIADVSRRALRVTVAAAVVVLGLAVTSMAMGPPKPCGDLPASYPPIIAFELARTGADLHALFGEGPGPCRDAMVAAMDRTNVLDLALFIPAYGTFLLAWFLGRRRGRLATVGVALAAIAVAFDLLENLCLLGLTPAIDPSSAWLARLPWATGGKWLALGAAALLAGVALVDRGRLRQLGAALCALAAIDTVAALAAPATFGPSLGLTVGLAWLVMLLDAVARLRRR
jgi:hypothetical protein